MWVGAGGLPSAVRGQARRSLLLQPKNEFGPAAPCPLPPHPGAKARPPLPRGLEGSRSAPGASGALSRHRDKQPTPGAHSPQGRCWAPILCETSPKPGQPAVRTRDTRRACQLWGACPGPRAVGRCWLGLPGAVPAKATWCLGEGVAGPGAQGSPDKVLSSPGGVTRPCHGLTAIPSSSCAARLTPVPGVSL